MTGRDAPLRLVDGLARILRDDDVPWIALGATPAQVLRTCAEEGVIGLIHHRLCRQSGTRDWPVSVSEKLAATARRDAVRERLHCRETIAVLDALAAERVYPVLLKGTPLAYTVYESPHLRPRCDTDVLVRQTEIATVRQVLVGLGYEAPPYCDGDLLFCQFGLQKRDSFDVDHAFDVHWRISTQVPFADLLKYDELAADSVGVPGLGPRARAAGPVHALLLACVHAVMHHRNSERLIWVHDIHLLAARLARGEWDRFLELAITRQVSAICAHSLALARSRLDTTIPEQVMAQLAAVRNDEPSAAYLQPHRRWQHELASNLRALRSWSDRLQLLREVVFPDPTYMLKAYGLMPGTSWRLLLPGLYLDRGLRGLRKVLTGRK